MPIGIPYEGTRVDFRQDDSPYIGYRCLLPDADTRCYGYLLSRDDVADVAQRNFKTLFGAELSPDDIKYIKAVRIPA